MFNKSDILDDTAPQEEVSEAPKETSRRKVPPAKKDVESVWRIIINEFVLIKSGSDFRLLPGEEWPQKGYFSLSASAFNALEKPYDFKHEVSNELLWLAGVVSNNNIQRSAVGQAIHQGGHKNLNVDEVIESLKGK